MRKWNHQFSLLLLVFCCSCLTMVFGQRGQLIRRQPVRVAESILKVNRLPGGDQAADWVTSLEINGPSSFQFRWSTQATGAVSARYVITDLRLDQEGAKIIRSVPLSFIPRPDQLGYFNIDFTPVIPATPPARPYALSYYVYIILTDADSKDRPPSTPVRISYVESGAQTEFGEETITLSNEYCAGILKLAHEALRTRFNLFNPVGDIQTAPGIGAYQLFEGVVGGAPASLEVSGAAPNPIIYVGVPRESPKGFGRLVFQWYRFTVDRRNKVIASPDPGSDVPGGAPPVLPNPGAWSKHGTYNGIPGDDPPHWSPVLVASDSIKIGDLHRDFQNPMGHAKVREKIEKFGVSLTNVDLTERAMEKWQSVKLCGFIQDAWFTSGDYGLDHTEDYHNGTDAPTGHLHEETDISWAGLDWDICVTPDAPYNYLASTVRPTIRVEIENFTLGDRFYWPKTDDWLQAVGRWVVDCGHTSYTEIHPPELLVSNTPNPYNYLTNRARVNLTGAWLGDPLDFVVYPPPRPSADARLTYRILRMDGTPGYDRKKNAELVITPRGTPGNPNHLLCQVVATGPGTVIRYNTGMVGHCGTRGLRCVVECGWEGESATVRIKTAASPKVSQPPTIPVKGAYLFYRSADAPASPWEVIRMSDSGGSVSLQLPVGANFWLRPAGSGWNFAQPLLDNPRVPYSLNLKRGEDRTVFFGALPDPEPERELSLIDMRRFSHYGRAPALQSRPVAKSLTRIVGDTGEAGNQALRSALISLEETGGPFGVKDNNLGYKETVNIFFRLKSLTGEDGQPIRDRESAIIVDSTTNPPSLALRGTPGEGVAGALVRARLLLGNEVCGFREAGKAEIRTGWEGLARFRVEAGTHVEDAVVSIEVLENPANPWFLPKIVGSSYLFFPGDDPANAADTAPGRISYNLRGMFIDRNAVQAIMADRSALGEGKHYLEEMREKIEFSRTVLKRQDLARPAATRDRYKGLMKKK